MNALLQLTDTEVAALADWVESGRVPGAGNGFALARAIGRAASPELVAAVAQLIDRCGTKGAATALRLAREARATARTADPQLVWSGEDTTDALRDTAVVVAELFRRAEREVLVSGFVVRDGRRVFDALAKRMEERPELRVDLFLNVARERNRTADASVHLFAQSFREDDWPGSRLPLIYYDPRSLEDDPKQRAVLHAKCVVVDRKTAFVTSANLTGHAQRRNIELGVVLEDPRLAAQVCDEFAGLVSAGRLVRLPV